MSNQLATLPANHFDGRVDELRKALPTGTITAEMLVRVTLTAINKTPALRECSEASLLGCMMDLAAIGLVPNTPDQLAYLIPYWNERLGVKEATIQVGYLGFCHLSYRSGQVRIIKSAVVRDGDEIECSIGTGENAFVRHVPALGVGRNKRAVLGAWAAVEMMNGGRNVELMDADELAKVEQLANAKKKSPAWAQWADQMRRKTVLKRLLKTLKISGMDTVAQAIEIDNRHADLLPRELPAPKEHRLTWGEENAEPLPVDAELAGHIATGPPPSLSTEERDAEGSYLF